MDRRPAAPPLPLFLLASARGGAVGLHTQGVLSWLRGPWGGEGLGAEAWLLTLPQQGGLCQVPPVKASRARESGLEPGLVGQLRPGAVPVEASPSTLAACGLLSARPPDPPPLEAPAPRPDPFPRTPCSLLSARPRGPRGPVGSPLPVSLQGSPELVPLAGPSRLLAWGPSPWKWSLRGTHRVCSLHGWAGSKGCVCQISSAV